MKTKEGDRASWVWSNIMEGSEVINDVDLFMINGGKDVRVRQEP